MTGPQNIMWFLFTNDRPRKWLLRLSHFSLSSWDRGRDNHKTWIKSQTLMSKLDLKKHKNSKNVILLPSTMSVNVRVKKYFLSTPLNPNVGIFPDGYFSKNKGGLELSIFVTFPNFLIHCELLVDHSVFGWSKRCRHYQPPPPTQATSRSPPLFGSSPLIPYYTINCPYYWNYHCFDALKKFVLIYTKLKMSMVLKSYIFYMCFIMNIPT